MSKFDVISKIQNMSNIVVSVLKLNFSMLRIVLKKIVSRLLGNSESNEKYSRVAKTSEDYHMIVSSCQSLPRDRKFPIF